MSRAKKAYDTLDDKEKLRRLEWIAQCYAAYLNLGNWKDAPFLDCTKYWDDFQKTLDEPREGV